MDFKLQKKSLSTHDFSEAEHEKITSLCNVYGLSQEQTRQLMSELRSQGNIEIDSSIKHHKQSEPHRREISFDSALLEEEYSFKQMPKHSFEHHQAQELERLRLQNQQLKTEKSQLANKISSLLRIREQDSGVLLGFQNTISSLAGLLRDKETAYSQLQEQYSRVVNPVHIPKPDPIKPRNLEKRNSQNNILAQVSLKDSNIERRMSKEFHKTKSTSSFFPPREPMRKSNIENSQHLRTEASRQSKDINQGNQAGTNQKYRGGGSDLQGAKRQQQKIDIGKYKVFIDQLRNICTKQKP